MMKIVIKPLYYYINIIKPLLNDSIMMRMVIHLKLNQLPQINNELILNKHIHLNLNNLSRMVGFWPCLWHAEVPRSGIKPGPQQGLHWTFSC